MILFDILMAISLMQTSFPKFPSLIELNARPWLFELESKYKRTFKNINQIPDEELLLLRSHGYDIVWLMGIWNLGPTGLKIEKENEGLKRYFDSILPGWTEDDIIGSPYAIKDYVINPCLGTKEDILLFRQRLHDLGMQLYVDFVPNHSAIDMDFVVKKKHMYIQAPPSESPPFNPDLYLPNGVAYGRDPYSGAWKDTAQYNIWEPEMKKQLMAFLRECAAVADGVRCDMAMLLLNDVFNSTWGTQLSSRDYQRPTREFWDEAIEEVKAEYPSFQLMAEVYWGKENELLKLGFDWMYDKDGLYDRLVSGHMDNLRSYIKSTDFSKMTHFVENHDEERSIKKFGSVARAQAAAVASMTLPGMRLFFMGQTEGKANKLDVHLRRGAPEPENKEMTEFYRRLQGILKDEIFQVGNWSVLDVEDMDQSSWRFLCWAWTMENKRVVVIINYTEGKGYCRVHLPGLDAIEREEDSEDVDLDDVLNKVLYRRNINELKEKGLFVALDPFKAHILFY